MTQTVNSAKIDMATITIIIIFTSFAKFIPKQLEAICKLESTVLKSVETVPNSSNDLVMVVITVSKLLLRRVALFSFASLVVFPSLTPCRTCGTSRVTLVLFKMFFNANFFALPEFLLLETPRSGAGFGGFIIVANLWEFISNFWISFPSFSISWVQFVLKHCLR